MDSRYSWERGSIDSIPCGVNATIRIDLYSIVDADCGVGGSGESFYHNPFRVFFNAMFDNCDGKKYLVFKGLPKSVINIAKLEAAAEILNELAENPIIV